MEGRRSTRSVRGRGLASDIEHGGEVLLEDTVETMDDLFSELFEYHQAHRIRSIVKIVMICGALALLIYLTVAVHHQAERTEWIKTHIELVLTELDATAACSLDTTIPPTIGCTVFDLGAGTLPPP
jgi:hypothetical protein